MHVRKLKSQCNLRQFRKSLKSLTSDLGSSFKDSWERIESQPPAMKEIGQKVLSWTSYAHRPLSLRELQHALAVEAEDTDLLTDAFTPLSLILRSCAGLVVYDSNADQVRLINMSVRQHLDAIPQDWISNAESLITVICCVYLSFEDFKDQYACDQQEMDQLMRKYSFLAYASQYWGVHARGIGTREAREAVLKFLGKNQSPMFSFRCMYNTLAGPVKNCPTGITALHLAAFFGLGDVARSLMDDGSEIDAADNLGRTPLYLAAASGHNDMVRYLHEAGAHGTGRTLRREPTTQVVGSISICSASTVCRLPSGYDTWWYPPWAQNTNYVGGDALQAAAEAGHIEVVRSLLEFGMDPNALSGFHSYPLDAATFHGHRPVVEALLRHGAMIRPSTIQTSVYAADVGILRLFIEKLPEKQKSPKDDEDNPSHSSWGYRSGMEELQQTPADRSHLVDAIYAAALANRLPCTKYLIGEKVNINGNTQFFYRNALQAAASQGYIAMMALLLENGSHVNNFSEEFINNIDFDAHKELFHLEPGHEDAYQSSSKNSPTPDLANYVLSREQEDVYQAQGKKTANQRPSHYVEDDRHGSALQSAAHAGHLDALQLLLDHGARVNEYSGYYGTSLQAAAHGGHLEIVKKLVSAGAHINTLTGHFGNPLQAASAAGHIHVAKYLLEAGALINARGGEYGYALHACTRTGDQSMAQLLLDQGADINAVGGSLDTSLCAAAVGLPNAVLTVPTSEHLLVTGPARTEEWLRVFRDVGMHSNVMCMGGGVFGNGLRVAVGGFFRLGDVGGEEEALWDEGRDYELDYGGTADVTKKAYALAGDNAEMVEFLLDREADLNLQGPEWGTPVMAAAYAGRKRVIEILLKKGADVNAVWRSWYTQTALDVARRMEHEEVEMFLMEVGAR